MKEFLTEYWVEWILGLITGALAVAYKNLQIKLKKKYEEQDALKQGVVALLHDRLFQTCNFYISKGYIPLENSEIILDNVRTIYNAYHGLGGNGTGTNRFKRFEELPIRKEEEMV